MRTYWHFGKSPLASVLRVYAVKGSWNCDSFHVAYTPNELNPIVKSKKCHKNRMILCPSFSGRSNFPALAVGGADPFCGFGGVGDAEMRGVPLELFAKAKSNGDVAQQDPLGEGAGNVEVGTNYA
jgi:hypothetical protein